MHALFFVRTNPNLDEIATDAGIVPVDPTTGQPPAAHTEAGFDLVLVGRREVALYAKERRIGAERRVAPKDAPRVQLRRLGERRGASPVELRRMSVTLSERDLPIIPPTMAEREARCALDRHPNDPRHEQACNLPSRLGSCRCVDPPEPLTGEERAARAQTALRWFTGEAATS